jgi:transposase
VERRIGWIKNCRRLAQRYDKLAISFLAMVKLLFIRIYLPIAFPDTA